MQFNFRLSTKLLLSFAAGAITVIAFAPFDYAWLVLPTLSVLLLCWYNSSPRDAFWSGLAFGMGLYLLGTSWVYNSLAVYGGMPLWMGSIAVLGFSLLMASFIALCGAIVALQVPPRSWIRLALFAPAWVIFEWCKSWVLTGFPWMDLGYSQTDTLLSALAPIGGVYLVSFALALLASAIVMLIAHLSIPLFERLALLVGVVVMVGGASFASQSFEWGADAGPAVRIGIVQPNTPIEKKWGLAYRDNVIAGLVQRNNELLAEQNLDLIVWPETALPVLLSQTDAEFWSAVRPAQTALLTGLVERTVSADGEVADYNAAVLHCGDSLSTYRKRHLVPFGEYLPLKFLFQWVIDYLQLPMSDFSAWQAEQQLACGEALQLGLSICYEDAFSNEHRVHTRGATLLINISEDAWFGDSFAPHQRLQMAQMRARELALPLVRSANSGPSVLIDHNGKIMAETEQFVATTLSGQVQPRTGVTWFRLYGEWIIYVSFAALLIVQIVRRRRT